ncbi:hypothetical protein TWF718_006549 [Orbilia javanica]|uniref:Uncharacterized protein n=1 Tax=Orbilia javanica TaxID=47235 RepID=A0AAN8RCJ4_9PEZI
MQPSNSIQVNVSAFKKKLSLEVSNPFVSPSSPLKCENSSTLQCRSLDGSNYYSEVSVPTPPIDIAMRACRRLSTVICTAHTPYRAVGNAATRCQRFLSTSTDRAFPEAPPNAATRIQFMKSGPDLPEPEDGSPPESDNTVRRMLKEKFPGVKKMRHREKRAAQRGEPAKAKVASSPDGGIPSELAQPATQQDLIRRVPRKETTMSKIWEGERAKKSRKMQRNGKGKGKNNTTLEVDKPTGSQEAADGAPNRELISPIPTHLGNVINASLGNANSRYNKISYDALLDAVLTLSPGLALKIIQLKEAKRLRDAYLHCLVKEGLRKGDLIYYRTNGAIRIKKPEWAEKLHVLRVKRDILSCYSVDLKTQDIMFDYKLAAKIFGGHEFPTDTRIPGIPWVLGRRKGLTLQPRSSSRHDIKKMAEEVAWASESAKPTASDTPRGPIEPTTDLQIPDETSGLKVAPSKLIVPKIDVLGGMGDQGPSQVVEAAEHKPTAPLSSISEVEPKSTASSDASSKALLDGGYEYLRQAR